MDDVGDGCRMLALVDPSSARIATCAVALGSCETATSGVDVVDDATETETGGVGAAALVDATVPVDGAAGESAIGVSTGPDGGTGDATSGSDGGSINSSETPQISSNVMGEGKTPPLEEPAPQTQPSTSPAFTAWLLSPWFE
jgi:hypothetical protein